MRADEKLRERHRQEVRARRNETIEECAKVAEWFETPEGARSEHSVAAAIRALKATPGDETEPSTSCAKPTSV